MPLDPSISLNVTGGRTGMADAGGGPQVYNPLDMVNRFAETQNRLNKVKLFQQTQAARQKLGHIMATSDSIDAAIQEASKDPSVAAFVPDLVQTIAGTNNIRQEYLSKQYTRNTDAFTRSAGLLQGGLIDPASVEKNFPAFLANIPDETTRGYVKDSMGKIIKGLTEDLPEDPAAAKAEYAKRLLAAGFQTGSQDALTKQLPQPGIINTRDKGGNATQQPITTAPATPTILSQPGSVQNVGNPIAMGLPPQVTQAGGVRTDTGVGGAPASSPSTNNVPGTPVMSGLGVPLFDEKTEMKPPPVSKRDVAGNPAGLAGDQASALNKAHSTEDLSRFRSAQDTEAQLADVGHDVEALAKNGGFLAPGSGGDVRLGLAKFGKMFEDVTGSKLGIDADKISNAEDLMKATNRMTLDFLNSKLGNQREAAETIRNMTDKGMPGINNTLLGSRLMIGMIGALNQRTKDSYKWDDEWSGRNNGDLRNAANRFDEKFPAKSYINRALTELGMNEHGFTSKAALQKALDQGLITLDQAEAIRKNNGKIPDDLPKAE